MALDQSALLEVLEMLKGADVEDRIRSAATTIYQALIEAELSSVIGAERHERSDSRTAQRNGHRPKTVTTTAGDLELRIPKLRAGSFFPRCWSGACGSTKPEFRVRRVRRGGGAAAVPPRRRRWTSSLSATRVSGGTRLWFHRCPR